MAGSRRRMESDLSDDLYILTTLWHLFGGICTAMEFGVFGQLLSSVWYCCLDLQLMAGFINHGSHRHGLHGFWESGIVHVA